MADRDTLRALFNRPAAAAIEHLEAKGLRITWNWFEMLDEAHARAFTVAKAAQLDVLRTIRRSLLDALKQGQTLRQFRAELTPLLQAQGWWGKQIVVDRAGGAEVVRLGSPHRLKTIYKTNLQSAYMAARYEHQQRATGFEYLQYVAVLDSRTRPGHAALDGAVFRKDDPIWASISPPRGLNCRCRTRALTAGQVEREGLTVQSSEGRIVTRAVQVGPDRRSGELFPATQAGIRVLGPDGRPMVSWTDVGFNSSPLAGHGMDTLLARKAVEALGDAAGFARVADLVTAPTRLRAWTAFVDNTLVRGLSQGQTMTVGILPIEVARRLAERDTPVAPVVHVPDRLLVGPKAERHARRGDGLTRAEWASLPSSMRNAAWYRDTETGDIVAELEEGIYVMISPDGAVDSAYHDAAAANKIHRGRWVPIR